MGEYLIKKIMKKEIFLKQFSKELEYLASKLFNVYEIASDYEIISYSEEFYTPNFWKKFQKKANGLNVITNGIFENSDRRQIAFVPDNFIPKNNEDFENFFDFPHKLLKISIASKFKEYRHKDFLGSLMGLNIKRELMGDLILENGAGYIPVSNKIADIISNELTQIGKAPCTVEIVDLKEIKNLPKYKYDDKLITVSSKRLDNIVCAITNISRNKVIEPIEKGKILVDYTKETDKSKLIEIGSLITIKGFGKYKLFSEKGETKKGKERLLIKKYI
ncbi:YlmH family RNA-binding protein [Leptotrichia sp. oral taxon 498]|uniref:YlmH family RNA-binding protein n=1 Tax=Leptotrichia sp. oral taxon 498 TaxID=712368 RepID=UPI001F41FA15|nr:YlmH/Sll1252 family protein [Leptotrichia sp. oral taxon 498]